MWCSAPICPQPRPPGMDPNQRPDMSWQQPALDTNGQECGCCHSAKICELRCRTPRVDCIVSEVIVERCSQSSPVMEWLVGHKQLLYVEVSPLGCDGEAQQTTTGVRLWEGKDGEKREEVWSWSNPSSQETAVHGGQLVFTELRALEFALRVLGSYMTWHLALALRVPLELVGEARFRVSELDLGSDLRVPIERDGHICGYVVLLIVKVSGMMDPWGEGNHHIVADKSEAVEALTVLKQNDWRSSSPSPARRPFPHT
mmetsp:Transcript_83795/g.232224  ORF Transcript_83795/g.232224 Transcript_83795/m.232224 type:complete len:257 (-) Transcript_83795:150-920(-)